MSDRAPIPLTPVPVTLGGSEFEAICNWPYQDPFVGRLLREDIPQRIQFGEGRVWVYRDPDGRLVGFGSIDVCDVWGVFSGGRPHPYIPLLAVNPTIKSLGYGATIVRHLTDEAAVLVCRPDHCCDLLFLDVYTTSERAIKLYTELQFQQVTAEPLLDPQEGNKPYIVMAKRVSVAPVQGATADDVRDAH
jgi:ribosomal protein S18 acetylase RimI-like enzyme